MGFAQEKPNIVWIVCEDISPYLGSYGEAGIRTPNLDDFAREAERYTRVYTTSGVCAPSRSAIITGMNQISIGTPHMRTHNDPRLMPEGVPSHSAVLPENVRAFPEYLRIGIPVALSTDDRGMWDSNMSDEYYVAVKEFNLSWEEIVQMGRNSLQFAFVEEPVKQKLLKDYDKRVESFAAAFKRRGWNSLNDVEPVSYSFLCKHYSVCLE